MMHEENSGMSRRTFLRMGGMVAGAAVLAACAAPVAAPAGQQAESAAPAAQAGELQMYTRLTNNDQLAALSTRYADEHNGSKLTVAAYDGRDMLTKLTTAIAGGLPPDMVMLDIAFTAQFADRDVLMDIGQIVTDSGMKDDAFPGYDVGTTWKGKYVAYPMWSDCSALYFNKKLFADAGITGAEGPKNWKEVQEQATAVHGLGDDIWGFLTNVTSAGATWFLWAPFMWAAGGETFNADMTGTEFTSPPALEAAKLWVDMYKAGLSPIESVSGTWGDVEGLFTSGKAGMLLSGPYMVGLMADQFPEVEYGITLIPGPETGATSSFVGGDGMSIIDATKQKDAAIEAFKWITDAKLMKETALANNGTWINGLPPRNSAADAEYLELFPGYSVFVDALKVGTLVNHPAIYEIDKPLKLAFEKMMLESVPVEDAMAELDAAGDEILARYNAG